VCFEPRTEGVRDGLGPLRIARGLGLKELLAAVGEREWSRGEGERRDQRKARSTGPERPAVSTREAGMEGGGLTAAKGAGLRDAEDG
jgi:hypothetical protein